MPVEAKQKFVQKPMRCPECGAWLPKANGHKRINGELCSIVRCETDGCNHKRIMTRFARHRKSQPPIEVKVDNLMFAVFASKVYLFNFKAAPHRSA